MIRRLAISTMILSAVLVSAPTLAKDPPPPPVTLDKCTASLGTIAMVDGDTQGWLKFGLGSPRDLIAALALESGCFAPYDPAAGRPATFLMNVSAGDKEEIDRTVAMASNVGKTAANKLVGGIGGRALGGLMGGLGGKKKTLAAALRLISPASGQTLVTGQGESSKTTISISGLGTVSSNSTAAAYGSNKDGQLLVEAFIKAFNAVTQQGPAISAMTMPAAPIPAASAPQPAPAAASQR